METGITLAAPVRLAVRKDEAATMEFSPEQRKMIRDSFANGASDSEFAVLMEVARSRRLNPLMRQIYFVKRYDGQKRCEVWSTQISIDGLRAVAERTGVYDGQSEPAYEYDKDGKLKKCSVHVYRKDWSPGRSAVGVAFFEEYAQTKRDGGLTSFWATKPHIMLAKCAEALAIRKAFPEDTSGLYVAEEMGEEPRTATVPEPQIHPQPTFPATGRIEAPPPAAERTIETKAEPKKGAPSPLVLALFNRVLALEGGNKKLAQARFTSAAQGVFGDPPKPSNEWTAEDAKAVEEAIFPTDVPF
jgi:phage recombination protein Bet